MLHFHSAEIVMSIYRDHAHDDVHSIRQIKDTTASGRGSELAGDPGEAQYKHLRKASPANIALPRTLSWAASLPLDAKPTALLRQYPRVANVIAATWGDAAAFRTYMQSLMTDTRGNRRGFPPDVLQELGALALQRSQNDFEKRLR
jgi:hypothetical protein